MMLSSRIFFALPYLFLTVHLCGQSTHENNTLQGRILYQNSGKKPAIGVQIKEKDSNGDYSKDNGEYRLIFQTKRNGTSLEIEIGSDSKEGKKNRTCQ